MNIKKPNVTTAAAITFAVLTAGAGIVGAQELVEEHGERHSDEHREEIHEAIEEGDYATFVSLVGEDAKILGVINANNFTQLQELHQLREAGDREGAKALAEELGLPGKKGHGNKPQLTDEQKEAVKAALEANDYDAFLAAHGGDSNVAEHVDAERFAEKAERYAAKQERKAAISAAFDTGSYESFAAALGDDAKILERVNAENFSQFAEIHELRQAGDREGAKALAEQYGIERPEGKRGPGKGFGARGR